MKKILFVLLILLLVSCQTQKIETELIIIPPTPQRQEIKQPESQDDLINIIIYYDFLVSEWELWGETIKQIIKGPVTND